MALGHARSSQPSRWAFRRTPRSDLGATAKALAADRAAAAVARQLGCGVLVSLGGDAAVAGPAPGDGFAVAIADTCTSTAPDEAVAVTSGGLASSGIGVRHWRLGSRLVHHIVDPATGLPAATCWRTVSAAAATCVEANAATTAAVVMGAPAVEWLARALASRPASSPWTVRSSARRAGRNDRSDPTHRAAATNVPPRRRTARMSMAMTAVPATVGHGVSALWYLTRASGLVSLILLTTTVVLGIVASMGWTGERWPRFLSQAVHRNLSLFCLALIGVHIASTVGDGYVPIGLIDAVIPFRSPYRPIWVGFGALAFDMLLAVAITSALRRRIGVAAWRGVHWFAYACWPVAVLHGLGSGSDPRLPGAMLVFVLCTASVVVALAWRLASGRARTPARRVGGAVAGAAVLLVIGVFAAVGPLRPGWSHRAGTSASLLAQIARSQSASYASQAATLPAAPPAATKGIPAGPFQTSVTGTVSVAAPDASGESQVTLVMKLADSSTPLHVRIVGPAEDGGVAMRSSQVTFGPLQGQVSALEGATIAAVVSGPSGSLNLSMDLALDPRTGTLTGQVSGSSAT